MKFSSKRIKNLREDRGWSQEHLSEVAGVSHRTIQRMENSGNASAETIMAVAGAFSISPEELTAEFNEKVGDGQFKYAGTFGTVFLIIVLAMQLYISGGLAIVVDIPSLIYVITIPFGLSLMSNGLLLTIKSYSAIGWLWVERKEAEGIQSLLPVIKKLIHYTYAAACIGSIVSLLGLASTESIIVEQRLSVVLIVISYSVIQAELIFRPVYHKLNRLLVEQPR